jgi:large subunit ribosomal protein L21
MSYAIISLGGKQYRVQPGERLLVDRLKTDAGKTFEPAVLFVGGDGKAELAPKTTVTARVVEHVRGEKIRIGKYRPKTGYRKHTGFRASLTRIEIEAVGTEKAGKAETAARKAPQPPKADAKPAAERKAAAQPKPAAEPQPAAERKPAGRTAHPPKGYDEMTVAQIAEAAPSWRRPNLEAALEHERAHANRKGAIAALESALAAKEEQ